MKANSVLSLQRFVCFPHLRMNSNRMLVRALLLLIVVLGTGLQAQRRVALTIDDIPNVELNREQVGGSELLKRLDSLKVPVCAFFNERNADSLLSLGRDISVLEQWIAHPLVSPGNHSYSHPALSRIGSEAFLRDVERGEKHTRQLVKKHGKSLDYFRFPYNDLGLDSLQADSVAVGLTRRGYSIAPFSLESADYAYDEVYTSYLHRGDTVAAKIFAANYVRSTRKILLYLDSIALTLGQKKLSHIYLCHDNALNRDMLPDLVTMLRTMGFEFVSLQSVLKEGVYNRPTYYHGKHGISWVYRWISDSKRRKEAMKNEPSDLYMLSEYEKLKAR